MDPKRAYCDSECSNTKRIRFELDTKMATAQNQRTVDLITNHYSLTVSPLTIYHFSVTIDFHPIDPDGQPIRNYHHRKPIRSGRGPHQSMLPHDVSKEKDPSIPTSLRQSNIEAMKMFIEKYSISGGIFYDEFKQKIIRPVFDGVKNLYTIVPLTNKSNEPIFFEPFIMITDDRPMLCRIGLKLAAELDLEYLLHPSSDHNSKRDCVRALDIILRYSSLMTKIPKGDFLFPIPKNGDPRVGYKILVCGNFQTVKMIKSGLSLVVDQSSTVFYPNGDLLDLIRTILMEKLKKKGGQSGLSQFPVDVLAHISLSSRLNDEARARNRNLVRCLEKEIEGLQIEVNHTMTKRRYKIRRLTLDPLGAVVFRHNHRMEDGSYRDGKNISVVEYFKQEYKIDLKYRDFPCINVGRDARPIYMPPELCRVVKYQTALHRLEEDDHHKFVKETSYKPKERFNRIDDFMRRSTEENKSYAEEFSIDIVSSPIKVQGHTLKAPKLEVKNQDDNDHQLSPQQGKWDLRDKKFYEGCTIPDKGWVIVNFSSDTSSEKIKKFQDTFIDHAKSKGSNVGTPILWNDGMPIPDYTESVRGTILSITRDFNQTGNSKPLMILSVVMKLKNDTIYRDIKQIGDKDLGLNTQCIISKNLKKVVDSKSYFILTNLLMKFNTKLGGIACKINSPISSSILNDRQTLIIGADVTHPGEKVVYSIAAAVGSMSSDRTQYSSDVRVQTEPKQEIIGEFKQMVANLIRMETRKLMEETGEREIEKVLPKRVIIYRDGVSDGQFGSILKEEFEQIKLAFEFVQEKLRLGYSYRPKVTFIVVQKRQRTRFFPIDKTGSVSANGNIASGTIVNDTIVQNSDDTDFFLCSHYSVQGTSRPCHYYVLEDENKFNPGEIHNLTFALCHTYVKCTKALSHPPPVQYAHLAAFRARQHLAGHPPRDSAGAEAKIKIEPSLLNKSTLYFV
ncbi:protein argonaute-4-like [Brevipalpus obovatus]|uniref:protein argonaute-4-like n=1 Tax=Brevipalpus obovatus TaxID=246614 RepID=UPI003D9F155B